MSLMFIIYKPLQANMFLPYVNIHKAMGPHLLTPGCPETSITRGAEAFGSWVRSPSMNPEEHHPVLGYVTLW